MPVLAVDSKRGFPGGPEHAMRLVASDVQAFTVPRSGHHPGGGQPAALAGAPTSFFATVGR